MFTLKKVAGLLVMPLSVVLLLLVAGAVAMYFARYRRWGRLGVVAGTVLLLAISLGAVADRLVAPLEHRYPPLTAFEGYEDVTWVVVLGGGHREAGGIPATGQVRDYTLARLAEGIRIHRKLPDSRLLLTGGVAFNGVPNSVVVANAALELGVQPDAIVVETWPRDTADEARAVRERLGQTRFVLVSSASHLPRAVAAFQAHGLDPIPAPAQYFSPRPPGLGRHDFIPLASNVVQSTRAVHEYLGLLWYRWVGDA